MLAERAELRIHEVPVDWIDDPDSRVRVLPTALANLRGIVRVGTALARGRLTVPVLRDPSPPAAGGTAGRGSLTSPIPRLAVTGVASAAACAGLYILLYLLLREVMAAQPANAASLLITAMASTEVGQRSTFGVRGSTREARHQVPGLIAFGLTLALTSGALGALGAVSPDASKDAEVTALVAASVIAAIVRSGHYRGWFSRGRARSPQRSSQ